MQLALGPSRAAGACADSVASGSSEPAITADLRVARSRLSSLGGSDRRQRGATRKCLRDAVRARTPRWREGRADREPDRTASDTRRASSDRELWRNRCPASHRERCTISVPPWTSFGNSRRCNATEGVVNVLVVTSNQTASRRAVRSATPSRIGPAWLDRQHHAVPVVVVPLRDQGSARAIEPEVHPDVANGAVLNSLRARWEGGYRTPNGSGVPGLWELSDGRDRAKCKPTEPLPAAVSAVPPATKSTTSPGTRPSVIAACASAFRWRLHRHPLRPRCPFPPHQGPHPSLRPTPTLNRHFCPACGGPLFVERHLTGNIGLLAGSLDDTPAPSPPPCISASKVGPPGSRSPPPPSPRPQARGHDPLADYDPSPAAPPCRKWVNLRRTADPLTSFSILAARMAELMSFSSLRTPDRQPW